VAEKRLIVKCSWIRLPAGELPVSRLLVHVTGQQSVMGTFMPRTVADGLRDAGRFGCLGFILSRGDERVWRATASSAV
jgi:hypothetical protein